jgi:hypothetical protein
VATGIPAWKLSPDLVDAPGDRLGHELIGERDAARRHQPCDQEGGIRARGHQLGNIELRVAAEQLERRNADPTPLLDAQRAHFQAHADRLAVAAEAADGFDRRLLLWRLHSTTAAVRFAEAMLADTANTGH